MAISRGAGTEIIRSAWFEDVDSTDQVLIQGVQHHIYTVLSIVIYAQAIQTVGTNVCTVMLNGYDSKAGTTDEIFRVCRWVMELDATFVWGDKFSFNGFEPTNFTGPMDDATKQDAIADQGSSVAQYLFVNTTNAADNCEIGITYIDQNNA
tara:strand:- start:43 stop:495 length:453 start_codon:yes stop_codon:yes gene_type:complete